MCGLSFSSQADNDLLYKTLHPRYPIEDFIKLLDNGADANFIYRGKSSILRLAAMKGTTEKLKILLEYGADINLVSGKNIETALYAASSTGELDTVTVLLNHGANPDLGSQGGNVRVGRTPLTRATQRGHIAIVNVLLAHNVDVNGKTSGIDATALYFVSMDSNADILNVLLKAGASINIQQYTGLTALHIAAANGHTQTVKSLLDHGADPNVLDNNGKTSLFMALRNGNAEIVELLKAHNAKM